MGYETERAISGSGTSKDKCSQNPLVVLMIIKPSFKWSGSFFSFLSVVDICYCCSLCLCFLRYWLLLCCVWCFVWLVTLFYLSQKLASLHTDNKQQRSPSLFPGISCGLLMIFLPRLVGLSSCCTGEANQDEVCPVCPGQGRHVLSISLFLRLHVSQHRRINY